MKHLTQSSSLVSQGWWVAEAAQGSQQGWGSTAGASGQRGPPDSSGPGSQPTHPAGQHTESPLVQIHDGVVLALVPVHFLGPVSVAQLEDLK